MEVTADNFESLFPYIESSIARADFLAIDCELTGLKLNDEKDNCYETMEERYLALRSSTSQFVIIQFGLCPFYYNPDTDSYSHEAFNFYVFPKQMLKNGPNLRFLCESSSLEFLSKNGFDFNKWIYKGIPFLSVQEYRKLKENLKKWSTYSKSEDTSTPLPVPENHKKFVENSDEFIRRFLASDLMETKFENLTPYQRKLIFHNIKPNYATSLYFESVTVEDEPEPVPESASAAIDVDIDISSTSAKPQLLRSTSSKSDTEINANISKQLKISTPTTTTTNNDQQLSSKMLPSRTEKSRVLRVTKLNPFEQLARDDEKKKAELEEINKNYGFSKVIQKISESGKVIVGHNMLLDICHTINQFIEDLPDSLASFKELVQDTFPNLIDTKYMCTSHPFREYSSSSVLFDVVKRIQMAPFHLPNVKVSDRIEAVGYELTDDKGHEAGFDAFATGCCFLSMCQHLGTLQEPQKPRVLASSPLILPFLNKLYIMRMQDISYLNISGTDLTPSRSHVFYVTCPKEATLKNIQQIFNPFGNIQVTWKTDTSLFVALNDKDQSSLVMGNIECSSEYRVIPFTMYQKLKREEKKRPIGAVTDSPSPSPERAGDIFRKLVCGGNKSPPNGPKKRPKTE